MRTPTKLKIQQRESRNIPTEENKKRKTVFEFDINSDSSETTDLLVKMLQIMTLLLVYLFILFCGVCI